LHFKLSGDMYGGVRVPGEENKLTELIGKLMDALAAELGQLRNKPARREELITQISQLGWLCHAIKNGKDLSLDQR
jgi:hypothetical protein